MDCVSGAPVWWNQPLPVKEMRMLGATSKIWIRNLPTLRNFCRWCLPSESPWGLGRQRERGRNQFGARSHLLLKAATAQLPISHSLPAVPSAISQLPIVLKSIEILHTVHIEFHQIQKKKTLKTKTKQKWKNLGKYINKLQSQKKKDYNSL